MVNIFNAGSPKFRANNQPCCPECLAFKPLRMDGTIMRHRDQMGDPCPGSHKKPTIIKRAKPNKLRDK